jgi:hypothetical protein
MFFRGTGGRYEQCTTFVAMYISLNSTSAELYFFSEVFLGHYVFSFTIVTPQGLVPVVLCHSRLQLGLKMIIISLRFSRKNDAIITIIVISRKTKNKR